MVPKMFEPLKFDCMFDSQLRASVQIISYESFKPRFETYESTGLIVSVASLPQVAVPHNFISLKWEGLGKWHRSDGEGGGRRVQ